MARGPLVILLVFFFLSLVIQFQFCEDFLVMFKKQISSSTDLLSNKSLFGDQL